MAGHSTPYARTDATYSDAAIQFCLIIKNLFGLALRQTIGFVQSLLKLAGLDWGRPRLQHAIQAAADAADQDSLPEKPGALHLLVDSTGIKMLGEGEWKTKKHGAEYRRQWRKVHLGIDAQTLQIRAIEVTDNHQGDAQMLPSLLVQIPADEPISCVSGDGAFDTRPVMKRLPFGAQVDAFRLVRMRDRGKEDRWVCWLGTRFYGQPND
jgi:hypothetical protein